MNGSGKSIGRLPCGPMSTMTGPVETPGAAGGRHAVASRPTVRAASARHARRLRRNRGVRTQYQRPRQAGPEAIAEGGRRVSPYPRAMPDSDRNPHAGRAVHRRRRHHRRRARGRERPGAAVLDGARHRRPGVDPQRPAAARLGAQRLPGRHDRGGAGGSARRWALPAIIAFRDGGCVLPPPPSDELIREMMAFLACAPLDDDVVPDVPRGPPPRRRRRRARSRGPTRSPTTCAPTRTSSSSAAASRGCSPAPPRAGEAAVHRHREERRPRRHVVGEPLPGCARRHRQPLLLLLVRARRPLDRVLLAAPRAARLLPSGSSTRTTSNSTAGGTRASTA